MLLAVLLNSGTAVVLRLQQQQQVHVDFFEEMQLLLLYSTAAVPVCTEDML